MTLKTGKGEEDVDIRGTKFHRRSELQWSIAQTGPKNSALCVSKLLKEVSFKCFHLKKISMWGAGSVNYLI